MDLSSNDLEEYVEKLENLFLIEKSNKKYRHELTLLIENISCELNTSRKNENSLRDDLKKLIECGDLDINQKYVQAEEKCNKQQIEIVLLTKKIEELRNQTNLDLEIQKNEFLNKIKNIEETLGSQIVNLNSQLESQKICYETKEQELYNEMQMMQAASALEWDEKESNYKKQISDSANNLRFLQSRIRSMQCEINQLKTQLSILIFLANFCWLKTEVRGDKCIDYSIDYNKNIVAFGNVRGTERAESDLYHVIIDCTD
ncbi:uncharacterized protein LOC130894198 isoform X2 [Diorhabda carinulata]|uniref:uncharacterized protein LOC130894198 isoform X2 n=1 Tax=Diorhabda carinulata TaxID=1163345 RepID=UPI0025A0730E|nr:uncharacterized protein LOC130894198 isoform X2 [Diorhabda carinulata]